MSLIYQDFNKINMSVTPLPPPHYDIVGGTKIQKSSKTSETSDMTSEGLGEMFEGDSADTRAASADGGLSGGSRVRGHGSEDPHRR